MKARELLAGSSALSLGGTRTLPALYEAAGIRFDLSAEHIRRLMAFVHEELEQLH
ncbi:MAG TPA: hypothetical protein VK907_09660 [Phnomibacter sp.]|nr:hypothetical protein [Phnomibacter sp.]